MSRRNGVEWLRGFAKRKAQRERREWSGPLSVTVQGICLVGGQWPDGKFRVANSQKLGAPVVVLAPAELVKDRRYRGHIYLVSEDLQTLTLVRRSRTAAERHGVGSPEVVRVSARQVDRWRESIRRQAHGLVVTLLP